MSEISAKPMPADWRCEHCGAPMRQLLVHSVPLVECVAGCWQCSECGELHSKNFVCNVRVFHPPVPPLDFIADDLPF